MNALRTPDECFENLPGYSFAPNYVEISDGLRMHYVDEGPADAAPVLMLHGEPSWSYLYRKMVPVFTAAGHRAVAPDLIGFGRSDKPADRADYTYERHVGWVREFLEATDLRDITLICQDWGSLIGLRLLAENTDRFARAVVSNGFLPTGDSPPGDAFLAWQNYSQTTPNFHVGGIIKGGCKSPLTDEVIAAYDAPFPDDTYKEGARQFPLLVPTSPDDPAAPANRAAWEVLEKLELPVLTAFGDSDPITAGADRAIQTRIPGAAGQPHTTIKDASHFIQEDKGEELAQVAVEWLT
ncbi:MAG TPA: haloalkane dehalogenase [Acidimicrobiales bacterium]|nr:haloalkane dehalogenase [Acidimicrobiales bacterium]